MAQNVYLHFFLWTFAAVVAWVTSIWASGESVDWSQQLSQAWLSVLPPVYRRVGLRRDANSTKPDTTAVVLNWSRFPNVLQIASVLCSPPLEGIIAEVFIWNNSPNPITYDDFNSTGCPHAKIRIHNSPENLYFQARFMACARAKTPFCFVQDDDYLVYPEVIQALHARISEATSVRTIHLLPSHERLSTSLRKIHVNGAAPVHTSFAWLGHGAILPRSEAADFLGLLHALNASDAELQMADNYYTILSNRLPEIWFDQGLELGGGQPFTVGAEGHERNNRHILRAAGYLEAILSGVVAPTAAQLGLPYVSREPAAPETSVARAVCRNALCLLETNIPLLPADLTDDDASRHPRDMLELETRRRDRLANGTIQLYLDHSPSRAVDDRVSTYFKSVGDAIAGEYITLNYFDGIHADKSTSFRMVWFVDEATQQVLEKSDLSASVDGLTWHPIEHSLTCEAVRSSIPDLGASLQKCVFEWTTLGKEMPVGSAGAPRSVRVLLRESQRSAWAVSEVYLACRR